MTDPSSESPVTRVASSSFSGANSPPTDFDLNSPNTALTSSLLTSSTAINVDAASAAVAVGDVAASGPISPSKAPSSCERVISEILSTERLYLASLQGLQQHYLRPLQTASLQNDLGVKSTTIQSVFSNLDGIVGFHVILESELSSKLSRVSADEKVAVLADIFLKYADFLKMYTSYVNNYATSLHALTALGENKKWTRWLRETKAKSKDNLDLMSLLIMPVQRIPRYELLLKEVSRQSTGVHPQLTVALSKIIEINVHVNDTKRLVDRVADLLLVQVKLGSSIPVDQEKIFPAGSLYMPHRRLIREGELTKRGTSLLASDKARKYYLFNDLLLSTNSHDKYKHHVLLHHAEVSPAVEGDDKADVDLSLAFHLHCHQLVADGKLQAGEKQLLFCSSASEKQAWIRDIDLAIQESNANMSANAGFLSVVPDRLRRMSDNKRESSLMKPAPSSATNPISPTSATSPGHLQKPSLSINGGPYSHSRKSSASASPRTPAPGHHSKHPSTASAPVAPVAATAAAAAVAVAAAPATHTKQPSSADAAAVTGGHSKHASAASNSAGHSKHPSDASASGGAVDDTPVVPSSPPELAPVFLPISLTPPEEPSEIIATTAIPQPASPSSPTPVLDSEVADPEPVSSPLRSPLAVDVGGDDSSADLEAGWRIASERMYRISRNDITALKMLKTPTPNVKLAMEAVGALLNVTGLTNGAMTPRGGGSMTPRSAAANNSSPSKSMKKLDDWTALHSLLVKPNFLSILKAFNERCDAMPEKADRKIAQLMQDPTMTPEAVSKASLPAGVLWNWVRSYWHLKKSGSNGAITIISIPTVPTPRPVATPRVSAIPRPASATVASKSPAKPRSPRASIAHTNGSATPRFDNVKSKIGSIRPQSATPATEPTPFTGELPPIADLVKCKMQYRDTFVNYYHPPTDTYFQMGVKDRALVPVPEPKQTQLRAAEAAAAARALKAGVMIAAARPSGTVPKKAAAPSTGTTPVPPVATASTPRSPSKLPVKTPPTALKPVRPTSAVSGSTTARTSLASKKPLAGSASATSLPRSSLRPPVDVAAGATQEKHKIAPALPHKKA